MIRRPPRSTRTDTLFPYTTLFRSNRLWLRSEGERTNGVTEDAELEALYGHSIGPWWDVVAGVRQDFKPESPQTWAAFGIQGRSEEHTSELQSLMRISYAVFCLKKKKNNIDNTINNIQISIYICQ